MSLKSQILSELQRVSARWLEPGATAEGIQFLLADQILFIEDVVAEAPSNVFGVDCFDLGAPDANIAYRELYLRNCLTWRANLDAQLEGLAELVVQAGGTREVVDALRDQVETVGEQAELVNRPGLGELWNNTPTWVKGLGALVLLNTVSGFVR